MTEAVNALTQYAFKTLKANRVEIRIDPEHLKSRKVAERCGYDLEAVLKMNELRPDRTVPLPAYNNETKYGIKNGRSGQIGRKLNESV